MTEFFVLAVQFSWLAFGVVFAFFVIHVLPALLDGAERSERGRNGLFFPLPHFPRKTRKGSGGRRIVHP